MNRLGTFAIGMVFSLFLCEAAAGLWWHNEQNFIALLPTLLFGAFFSAIANILGDEWK